MTITNLAEPHEMAHFLYDADKPKGQRAILYFSASWCRPCQNMQGIVEQLHRHANEIAFGSIDVAQAPTLAPAFGIKSVPSLALFEDACLIAIIAGEVPLQRLSHRVAAAFAGVTTSTPKAASRQR